MSFTNWNRLKYLILFSLILLYGLYYILKSQFTLQLSTFSLHFFIIIATLHLIILSIKSKINFIILKKMNLWQSRQDCLKLNLSDTLFSGFLPQSSVKKILHNHLIKKLALNHRQIEGIDFFTSSLLFLLFGITWIIFIQYKLNQLSILNSLQGQFIYLGFFSILFFSLFFLTKKNFYLYTIQTESSSFFKNWELITNILMKYIIIFLLQTLQIYLIFHYLKIELTIAQLIELNLLLMFLNQIQIIPGNLWIKEFAVAYFSLGYGIKFELGLLAILLYRLTLLILLIPMYLIFHWRYFLTLDMIEI